MAQVIFVHADGLRQEVFAETGDSVMRAAVVNDVAGIDADCGGSLSCATCHVYVDDAWCDRLPSVREDENEMLDLTASDRLSTSRLSCQICITEALDGLMVRIPNTQS